MMQGSLEMAAEGNDRLQLDYKRRMRAAKIRGEYEFDYGHPGKFICEEATQRDASLVVMGTRGLGKMKRALLGSMSDYVILNSNCTVCVYRDPSLKKEKPPKESKGGKEKLLGSWRGDKRRKSEDKQSKKEAKEAKAAQKAKDKAGGKGAKGGKDGDPEDGNDDKENAAGRAKKDSIAEEKDGEDGEKEEEEKEEDATEAGEKKAADIDSEKPVAEAEPQASATCNEK